jgi:phosphoserine aminotransferase
MTERIYNFSAGPAVLPLEVLEIAKEDLVCYKDSGIGVMELSHRSSWFDEIIKSAEANLRDLLEIPDDYGVIFMGGGATTQFSMVPMNLLSGETQANYLLSGSWAKKACAEAKKFGTVHVAGTSEDKNFSYIPTGIELSGNPAYLHFTSNNTITGTEFSKEPDAGSVPLVCDASSDLMHKKIDVSKYGIIYAGAQKNLGPAGVTVVIIRKDLLDRAPDNLPVLMIYRTNVEKQSLYNTPPTFPIYVMGEVFKWVKRKGGLDQLEKINRRKAALLYDAIDATEFYQGTAEKDSRSIMNITFRIADHDLEPVFLEQAAQNGMVTLKGHRSVGGLRASLYNAFPEEGAAALVNFMKEFEKKHG